MEGKQKIPLIGQTSSRKEMVNFICDSLFLDQRMVFSMAKRLYTK